MHTSTVNISQTIKGRVNITIAIKYDVPYGLLIFGYLDLTLVHLTVKVKVMHISTANI